MLTTAMQRANTALAERATWVAPYPNPKTIRDYNDVIGSAFVFSAVAYLTCINIALDNATQALERWCDKWL